MRMAMVLVVPKVICSVMSVSNGVNPPMWVPAGLPLTISSAPLYTPLQRSFTRRPLHEGGIWMRRTYPALSPGLTSIPCITHSPGTCSVLQSLVFSRPVKVESAAGVTHQVPLSDSRAPRILSGMGESLGGQNFCARADRMVVVGGGAAPKAVPATRKSRVYMSRMCILRGIILQI